MKKILVAITLSIALVSTLTLIFIKPRQKPSRVEQLLGLDIKSDEAQSFLGQETGQLKRGMITK